MGPMWHSAGRGHERGEPDRAPVGADFAPPPQGRLERTEIETEGAGVGALELDRMAGLT